MSAESSKQIVSRFVQEGWNNGNHDVIYETHSEDLILHGGDPETLEGLRNRLQRMNGAFGDIHVEVEDQLAEADRVATRMTVTGTHVGPFMGTEPTNREVTFDVMDFVRIADGKIVEQWDSPNLLAVLMQIGAIPVPG